MTRNRSARRALLACSTLFVYLLAVLLPFDQMVLCIRSDGHVGLEPAGPTSSCLDCGVGAESIEDGCCARSGDEHEDAPCRDVLVFQHQDAPGMRSVEFRLTGAPVVFLALERQSDVLRHRGIHGLASGSFVPPRAPPERLALVLRV